MFPFNGAVISITDTTWHKQTKICVLFTHSNLREDHIHTHACAHTPLKALLIFIFKKLNGQKDHGYMFWNLG